MLPVENTGAGTSIARICRAQNDALEKVSRYLLFKRRVVPLFIITTLLCGCLSISYTRIQTENEFYDKVVDKPLSWPGGYNVRFYPEGKILGQFPNGKIDGEWVWRDGLFCRSIRIAKQPRPDECLQIEYSGDQVRFKRKNGGYFLPYRIGTNSP